MEAPVAASRRRDRRPSIDKSIAMMGLEAASAAELSGRVGEAAEIARARPSASSQEGKERNATNPKRDRRKSIDKTMAMMGLEAAEAAERSVMVGEAAENARVHQSASSLDALEKSGLANATSSANPKRD